MTMAGRCRELVGIPGRGRMGVSVGVNQTYYVYRLKNGKTRVRSHDHKDWTNPNPSYHPIIPLSGRAEPVTIDIDKEDVLLISSKVIQLAEQTGTALPVKPIATVTNADGMPSTNSVMVAAAPAPVNAKAVNLYLSRVMMAWLIELLQTERKLEDEQLKELHEMCLEIVHYAYSDMLFSMTFGEDTAAWETAFGTLFKGTSVRNSEYSRKSNTLIEKYSFKRQYLFPAAFIRHNTLDW